MLTLAISLAKLRDKNDHEAFASAVFSARDWTPLRRANRAAFRDQSA